MIDLLNRLEYISAPRQQNKVKHSTKDIVGIVLFATLANANEWTEIEDFAVEHQSFLKQYFELPNGIPSHNTLSRVMGYVNPEVLQRLYLEWNNCLSQGEGEKLKKSSILMVKQCIAVETRTKKHFTLFQHGVKKMD